MPQPGLLKYDTKLKYKFKYKPFICGTKKRNNTKTIGNKLASPLHRDYKKSGGGCNQAIN